MKITTAPFDALYELPPAVPSSPSTLAIVTRLPRSPSTSGCSSIRAIACLHDEERAGEVDVEHALPLVAVEQVRGTAARDAGRGDDRVEPTVLGDRGVDHAGDRRLRRARRPATNDDRRARRPERRARVLRLGDVETDDPRALPHEARDAREPDPRRRTRDERDLAFAGFPSLTSLSGRPRFLPARLAPTIPQAASD